MILKVVRGGERGEKKVKKERYRTVKKKIFFTQIVEL